MWIQWRGRGGGIEDFTTTDGNNNDSVVIRSEVECNKVDDKEGGVFRL